MKRIRPWVSFKITYAVSPEGNVGPIGDSETAGANRLLVIEGALTVEKYLKDIIAYHFFGIQDEKANEFKDLVLNARAQA